MQEQITIVWLLLSGAILLFSIIILFVGVFFQNDSKRKDAFELGILGIILGIFLLGIITGIIVNSEKAKNDKEIKRQ